MSRGRRGSRMLLCLFVVAAVMGTVAQTPNPPEQAAENSAATQHVQKIQHGVPWRDAQPIGLASGPHLTYYGGPVISNVHVVQVLYGSGTYATGIASGTPSIASFFTGVVNSSYIDWLSEYNTDVISGGTNQSIGRGTFDGEFTIVPSAANNGSSIDDTNIQAELAAQINAGHLPAPVVDASGNTNSVYMVFFPHGKSITQGGSASCVSGGFCAYHGTFTRNSQSVLYGVMPDMGAGSGCDTGCGNDPTPFNNVTSVASHELGEAITDADVGLATSNAPPLAWYDSNNGEIGDICNASQGTVVGGDGRTYVVQKLWSNAQNACVVSGPGGPPNFALSASPSSLSVVQGSSNGSTVTVIDSGGFSSSVSLSASGLPSGVTASFGTNPTASTSSITFTASATATTGTTNVTITGTSGTLTHTTTISLTVNPAPDFSISATPPSNTVIPGGATSYSVGVTGSNGFAGVVGFGVSGLPTGASAGFNPTSVTGSGSSTMSVTTSTSTPPGTYTLTITGSSPGLSHSTTVTLVVNAAPDFSISATPPTLTVARGSSDSYTVTITGNNGFAGAVSLSVSGLGSKVSGSFNPASITGSGTSTLTITAAKGAAKGSRTIAINGSSGSSNHSTSVSLTIH